MLTTVKEELIKPEITIEDDGMHIGNHNSLGLDNSFNLQSPELMFEICSGDHSKMR
jgi:hypothetical protein